MAKKADKATLKKASSASAKNSKKAAACQQQGRAANAKKTRATKRRRPRGPPIPFASPATFSFHAAEVHSFPPTIFTNAVYRHGIRLPPATTAGTTTTTTTTCRLNEPYFGTREDYASIFFQESSTFDFDRHHVVPILTPEQALLWNHKFAATSAAQNRFPANVARLLGTISRILSSEAGRPHLQPSWISDPKTCGYYPKMTKPQAAEEAMREQDTPNVPLRAADIQRQWLQIADDGPFPVCGWDGRYGHLLPQAVQDEEYVPIQDLLDWNATDEQPSLQKELYNGLVSIPIDTFTVLKSLAELSSPVGLYQIPFITAYPILQRIDPERRDGAESPLLKKCKPAHQRFRLTIAVYANRLLPEVMTQRDLHIVMSALDQGSYRLTQPLHLCPVPDKPVFQSAEYPKVVLDNDDDKDDGDEKKQQDLTIQGSTRDEGLSISAFSIPGLMKLLENTGNDMSHYTPPPLLRMDLMLHQQHAVCWMVQMESLGGFGLNSILWEEREFLDGGAYYYSPALGQIRLMQPPTCRGGILADEQGMGKTIEVMGLITSTLDELRSTVTDADLMQQATLIVVPPALVSQWISEIHKCCGDHLVVQYYDAKTQRYEPKSFKRGCPDIVVTTYNSLESYAASKCLADKKWGRIVLDEMQEIRSSTTTIAKNCDKLYSQRRWMLSGTPLFEGIDDLRGELNFLSIEPFCAKLEDGFFNYAILNHWKQHSRHGLDTLKILGLLALRRSKSMTICETGAPLLGLPPLTVEFVPVPQRASERALYCFLEQLVARELSTLEGCTSTNTCLRLLRQMCISPVLLNGGVGVCSQLHVLNSILVRENRRCLGGAQRERDGKDEGKKERATDSWSCGQAIRYLTQVQESVTTDNDFVSGMTLGTGGGMARRNRATESIDALLLECKDKVAEANEQVRCARSKKARTRWHWLLEMVTIGGYPDYPKSIKRSVMALWRWRWLLGQITRIGTEQDITNHLPLFLVEGWSPSKRFVNNLFAANKGFAWAHPRSLELTGIPCEVTIDEIKLSIVLGIGNGKRDAQVNKQVAIHAYKQQETWRSVVQFENPEHMKVLEHQASLKNGIAIHHKHEIPRIQKAQAEFKSVLDDVKAEHTVYPTKVTHQNLKLATKQYDRAMLGLRIVSTDPNDGVHVVLGPTRGPCRSMHQSSARGFREDLATTILEATGQLDKYVLLLEEEREKIKRYQRALEIPDAVKQISAYETLVALSEKDFAHTWCPICMDHLGVTKQDNMQTKPGMISLTHCGHLFCQLCLDNYVSARRLAHQQTPCPTCRKRLDVADGVIAVDPNLTSDLDDLNQKRMEAKRIIQQASKILETSNGQLEAAMWEQLYLSIDLPMDVSTAGEPRLTAIPREVLQHLRAATGMETHCKSNEIPPNGLKGGTRNALSSKIHALLAEIPKDERCVIFSGSIGSINHLTFCFRNLDMPHQALYTGQNAMAQEHALAAWKSSSTNILDGRTLIPFPILVVQSGAAASGLTLTDACKIFLLEPFSRQEEEQQAYARCYRYGQSNPVHVKVFYTPVSVESRLLEWRKKAGPYQADGNVTTIFASLDVTEEDGDDKQPAMSHGMTEEDEDTNQTLFLLGLVK